MNIFVIILLLLLFKLIYVILNAFIEFLSSHLEIILELYYFLVVLTNIKHFIYLLEIFIGLVLF
jgi:hypothetical protein